MRAPHPTLAFWCERITYRTLDADDVADVSRYATTAPAEAIRRIRAEVRALAYALPPIERHRALSWVDGGGCVGAMGALHRGSRAGSRSVTRAGGPNGPSARTSNSSRTAGLPSQCVVAHSTAVPGRPYCGLRNAPYGARERRDRYELPDEAPPHRPRPRLQCLLSPRSLTRAETSRFARRPPRAERAPEYWPYCQLPYRHLSYPETPYPEMRAHGHRPVRLGKSLRHFPYRSPAASPGRPAHRPGPHGRPARRAYAARRALLGADFAHPDIVRATELFASADGVVIGTPVYKAAYSGLLKSLLDLLPQYALTGKTVLPLATGGSTAHVLAIDYALRPVLSSMGAAHIVQGWFVLDRHITVAPDDTVTVDPAAALALEQVVDQFSTALDRSPSLAAAG